MKLLKYILPLALCGCLSPSAVQAKAKQVPAYMFGYAVSMIDSTAYLTDIQRLDTVILENKTSFLRDRQLYSAQLNAYLEDKLLLSNMTCVVFYNQKRKKLEKVRQRVNKTQQAMGMKIKPVATDDFSFHPELWATLEDERANLPRAERKALEKADKEKQKEQKKALKDQQKNGKSGKKK